MCLSTARPAREVVAPGVAWPPSDDGEFAAIVAAVTSAFGDPTRREVFLFVRSGEGSTAGEVAERFGLHPNVARHHLDKLAAGGYLEVFVERAAQGGAGRPSKRYRTPPGERAGTSAPGSRSELMTLLLARALSALQPEMAESLAEEVGEDYGRTLASQVASAPDAGRSLRSALATVADAMTAHGFAAHLEEGSELGIVSSHCPFGDLPTINPVICAVDRGMVRGMLASLSGASAARRIVVSSRARGDAVCSARV